MKTTLYRQSPAKMYLLFFLLIVMAGMGYSVDIAKTYTITDFTYGSGYNISAGDGFVNISAGLNATFYSSILTADDGLIWDKFNWDADIPEGTNLSLQSKTLSYEYQTDSLMAYWNFSNTNNSRPNNLEFSFINNISYCNSNPFIRGGICIQFSNSSARILNNPLLTPTANFTIDIWIKPNETISGSSYKTILAKKEATTNDDYLLLIQESNGQLLFYVGNGTNRSNTGSTALKWLANQTYRVMVTYNTNGSTCFYRDNVAAGCGVQTAKGRISNGTYNLLIGNYFSASFKTFVGEIGSLALYDRYFTIDEATEPYFTGGGISAFYMHEINQTGSAMPLSSFQNQMAWLNESGYSLITWQDLHNWRAGTYTLPKRAMILNADAVYLSMYQNASPVLDSYGFKFNNVIYVTGQTGNKATWTNIKELISNGYGVSSYSYDSADDWSTLNYTERIRQMNLSKNNITAETGIVPYAKTFPYGSWNSTTLSECLDYYEFCVAVDTVNNSYFISQSKDFSNIIGVKALTTPTLSLETFKQYVTGYYEWDGKDGGYNDLSGNEYINQNKLGDTDIYLQLRLLFKTYQSGVSPKLRKVNVIKLATTQAGIPSITSYASGIETLNATYSPSSKTLTITCTGTGNIGVEGLSNVVGTSGFYSIYHDGVLVQENVMINTYTITSCSNWEFKGTDSIAEYTQAVDDTTSGLANMIKLFGIIAGIIVVWVTIAAFIRGDLDMGELQTIMFILIGTAVCFAVLFMVLEGL